jgi:nucleotide-binding universal stress UspA family protein
MQSIKHILVATDFGQAAARAEALASELAAQIGAHLTFLHVYSHRRNPYGAVDQLVAAAQAGLRRAAVAVSALHADVRTAIRCGSAGEEILAAAVELDADLVMMGTHGRRGLDRVVLGSVAEHVVRASRVPVLTVHAGEPQETSAAVTSP